MEELTSFFFALFKHWIALMSGAVSLGMTIALRARGKEPKDKVFWSIAALCLLVACFLAWRDEHSVNDKARQELAGVRQELAEARDQNAPRLACHIDKVVIGE